MTQAWIVAAEVGPPTPERFRVVSGVDLLNKPGRTKDGRPILCG